MNHKIMGIVDNLMQKSHQKLALKGLEKLFNTGIPFNSPHKFEFVEISEQKTLLRLPFIRKNKNHLGGMHACAVATLGEFPAGLSLIKKFGATRYRLIMKRIQVEYFKQAKSELTGEVIIDHHELDELGKTLRQKNKAEIIIITNILNPENEVVSVVHTTWQLKNWKEVQFK